MTKFLRNIKSMSRGDKRSSKQAKDLLDVKVDLNSCRKS